MIMGCSALDNDLCKKWTDEFSSPEYASVGYMAKRIQMRKNRFLALQKMAEQKKNEAMNATNAAMNDGGPPDHHGIPKQTVSLDN